MSEYDVVVVGGGPAGSTAAGALAKAGAKVLVLDKARFPRDKPCGGGVTARALAQAPVDLAPVIELQVSRVRFSFRLGHTFYSTYPRTLVYMTQRQRLDAFLLENAAGRGAEVRDGTQVRAVSLQQSGAILSTGKEEYRARVVIGADGCNGVVARSLGLAPAPAPPVALEASYPFDTQALPAEWQQTLALDLGSLDGGYGWSFPKADHFNVGCGGFRWEGGRLRDHLTALGRHYGLDADAMANVRGHHLPTREAGTAIQRGPAVLVGDAAGLVDPMSGEGIYSAFVSGRLAADAVLDYLAGRSGDLTAYEAAVERDLMVDIRAAARLRDAYHHAAYPCYQVMRRSGLLRRWLCQLMTGERSYTQFMRQLGPFAIGVGFWAALGRRARARRALAVGVRAPQPARPQ